MLNKAPLERQQLTLEPKPYEPEVSDAIRAIVQPGWVVVDVGSHVGNLSVLLAQIVSSAGKVYAFDAFLENTLSLRSNAAILKLDKIIQAENFAITDGLAPNVLLYSGRRDSSYEWNLVGHDVDGNPTSPKFRVSAVSLDQYFVDRAVNFIKIDVEGSGYQVCQGMKGILRNSRPTILFEFHSAAEWRAGSLLAEYNYILIDLYTHRIIDPSDIDGRPYHCLAFPKENFQGLPH